MSLHRAYAVTLTFLLYAALSAAEEQIGWAWKDPVSATEVKEGLVSADGEKEAVAYSGGKESRLFWHFGSHPVAYKPVVPPPLLHLPPAQHPHHPPPAAAGCPGYGCPNPGFNPGSGGPTGPILPDYVPPPQPLTTSTTSSSSTTTSAESTTSTTTTTTTSTTTTSTTANTSTASTAASTSRGTSAAAAGVITPGPPASNCTCVPADRCDPAHVHTFGTGQIDPRRGTCLYGVEVCCTRPLSGGPPYLGHLVGCGVSKFPEIQAAAALGGLAGPPVHAQQQEPV
jgi:hypothetical protein